MTPEERARVERMYKLPYQQAVALELQGILPPWCFDCIHGSRVLELKCYCQRKKEEVDAFDLCPDFSPNKNCIACAKRRRRG